MPNYSSGLLQDSGLSKREAKNRQLFYNIKAEQVKHSLH